MFVMDYVFFGVFLGMLGEVIGFEMWVEEFFEGKWLKSWECLFVLLVLIFEVFFSILEIYFFNNGVEVVGE